MLRILVTGASGQLGAYLLEPLLRAGHKLVAWSHVEAGERLGVPLRPVNLADERAVAGALAESDPEVILHAGGISSADAVRRDPQRGWDVNVGGTLNLTRWCRDRGRRLVFISTDMVFGGTRSWYSEEDPVDPILAYGRSKAEAERHVLEVSGGLVTRLSLLYGESRAGRESFFVRALADLAAGRPREFFDDEYRTPLHYRTAAECLVGLLEAGADGIVHVGGRERLSRLELMRRAASAVGLDPSLALPAPRDRGEQGEPRPADLSLATARLERLLPDLERPNIEAALRQA